MARDLVFCPSCGRRVALHGPRRLGPHRIPVNRLAELAAVQPTLDGDTVLLSWPRCALSGAELSEDPPRARVRGIR